MGIGWLEIVLILAVALVVLGPAGFPNAARKMGRFYREMRDALGSVGDEVARAAGDLEREDRPSVPATGKTSGAADTEGGGGPDDQAPDSREKDD
ncbi:twin-arginine translocase subunit TatB [Myxococcota bacterium]|nr:twin-arginine translocase subunit TatB [Myxococcota bacterium]HOD08227.1 Sec-independent protein translocase protein TatB [Myxococcota bacterium]